MLILVGATISACTEKEITYDDDCPAIYKARLIKPARDYQPRVWDSYAVYGDLPIVKETDKDGDYADIHPCNDMAMWRTKDATYLALVSALGWVRTFYIYSDKIYLRDCDTGEKYPIIEIVNFPFNQEFFIEGVPGDHIYILLKFPPLPKTTRCIDYYEPYANQEYAFEYNDLSIEALEANHHIIDPAERKIVY
ncbi:MAG: hypothetical protein E7103_00520 [Prevotella sp.]|nr:hypothetical protein [Prevotella sp.]